MDSIEVNTFLQSIVLLTVTFRAIILAYEQIAGNTLEEAIESECSRDLRKGYKAIVRLAGNPAYYYARTIYKAMKGVGTDEITIIRHIVNTSEVHITAIHTVINKFLRFC